VLVALLLATTACNDDDEPSSARRGDGTTTAPTPSTAGPTARLVDAACDDADSLERLPPRLITGSEIVEASGVAMLPGTDGPVWAHNDSGDRARVFSVVEGDRVTVHDVPGAEAVDWEDMAAGPDGRLYLGDIGDNDAKRPSITVYRFPAPDPAADGPVADVETTTLTYEDGPHNAEALMIDPVDELLVIVTKGDGPAGVYATPLASGDGAVLERVGEVDTGGIGPLGLVTGGDISPDGSAVLLRTYGGGHLYRRPAGQPLAAAFTGPACDVPTGLEIQGEAIAFTGTGDGYLTMGEGQDPTISGFAAPD
jgi:sugar lactone lactonase YvrE